MSENEHTRETIRTYDEFVEEFDRKFGEHFEGHVRPFANEFLAELPAGARVLDLGSGPGNHAAYFVSRGLDVLCGDLSEEMVRSCRAKGLRAEKMDIEDLRLPERSFGGVWAYCSLLHLPKTRIAASVSRIASLLTPRGLLGVALKAVEGEGFETHVKYPGTRRWFAYYTDAEVRTLFRERFDLLSSSSLDVKGKYTFLNYLFRLR